MDADYWLITESDELSTENLLYDGCHPDMESILLSSPAMKKVLRNNLSNFDIEKIHALADTVDCEAQRLAMEFGYFRLLNHIEDSAVSKCNAIDLADVIDEETLELDREFVASETYRR